MKNKQQKQQINNNNNVKQLLLVSPPQPNPNQSLSSNQSFSSNVKNSIHQSQNSNQVTPLPTQQDQGQQQLNRRQNMANDFQQIFIQEAHKRIEEQKSDSFKTQSDLKKLQNDHQKLLNNMAQMIRHIRKNFADQKIALDFPILYPDEEEIKIICQNCPEDLWWHIDKFCKTAIDLTKNFILEHEQQKTKPNIKENEYIFHEFEQKKLQFMKQETEYKQLLESLQNKYKDIRNKLFFINHNSQLAIDTVIKDNEELVELLKRKGDMLEDFEKELQKKTDFIKCQDEKLLSVLIFETKIKKLEIKYRSEKNKVLKDYYVDIQSINKQLESVIRFMNGCSLVAQDQEYLGYLRGLVDSMRTMYYKKHLTLEAVMIREEQSCQDIANFQHGVNELLNVFNLKSDCEQKNYDNQFINKVDGMLNLILNKNKDIKNKFSINQNNNLKTITIQKDAENLEIPQSQKFIKNASQTDLKSQINTNLKKSFYLSSDQKVKQKVVRKKNHLSFSNIKINNLCNPITNI